MKPIVRIGFWLFSISFFVLYSCSSTKLLSNASEPYIYTKPCLNQLEPFFDRHWMLDSIEARYILSDSAAYVKQSRWNSFDYFMRKHDSCFIGSTVADVIHLLGEPNEEMVFLSKRNNFSSRIYIWKYPKKFPKNMVKKNNPPISWSAIEISEDTASHRKGVINFITNFGEIKISAFPKK